MYGNPEVTTGGNALKFYSSVRLDVRRIKTLEEAKEQVGIKVRAKVRAFDILRSALHSAFLQSHSTVGTPAHWAAE